MSNIVNPNLRAMIELSKQRKELAKQEKEATKEVVVKEEPEKPVELFSLSLNLEEEITKEIIMENVKILPRSLRGDVEDYKKARRKVARLTTGASAATPLICKGDLCPFKEKCVSGDTLVLTPDGTRKIKSLKRGDIIYSVDASGRLEEDIVCDKRLTGREKVYKVKTQYGLSVKITDNHRFLTLSEGFRTYRSIKSGIQVGSVVFIADVEMELDVNSNSYGDLYEDTITEIVELKEEDVYDITVKYNANFLANSILVHNCSYYIADIHEEGEDCLVEEQLIEFWTKHYLEDLNIDMKSISEMHILSRLVEITIMDLRMTKYLSINNPDLMMDFVTAADLNDQPLTQKGISIAFEVKDRLEKQKLKLLESLNSTREKRFKTAINIVEVQNTVNSKEKLMDKLDKLAEELRKGKKGSVIDHD